MNIVLDCDGVCLQYSAAYVKVYKKAFGVDLERKRPGWFHAYNEYDCVFKTAEEKEKFYTAFTEDFWADMPLCDGASEACHRLVDAGYTLHCVTSMPVEFLEARKKNFLLHNLPISETHATGRDHSIKDDKYNPKLEILRKLRPIAFVDDFGGNFNFNDCEELSNTYKALIDRNQPDSPNPKFMHLVDGVFENLQDFVTRFLAL